MTTREKLADKIEKLCGNNYFVDPSELCSNKGPRWASDIAAWNGVVRLYKGGMIIYYIASWDSMGSLVKKKGPLVWIGNDNFEIA